MASKTHECPHCFRTFEIDHSDEATEAEKRLRRKVEALESQRRALLSELNYQKLEANRMGEALLKSRLEADKNRHEIARLTALVQRPSQEHSQDARPSFWTRLFRMFRTA